MFGHVANVIRGSDITGKIATTRHDRHGMVLEMDHAVDPVLERVVQAGGTATKAQVPGYRVAGKTGTAWKIVNGQYADNAYVATFVGYAPVSDPRYIIGVMIDEPTAGKFYGGDVSAPVFSQVMGAALRMMAIPPDAEGHQALATKKDGVPG